MAPCSLFWSSQCILHLGPSSAARGCCIAQLRRMRCWPVLAGCTCCCRSPQACASEKANQTPAASAGGWPGCCPPSQTQQGSLLPDSGMALLGLSQVQPDSLPPWQLHMPVWCVWQRPKRLPLRAKHAPELGCRSRAQRLSHFCSRCQKSSTAEDPVHSQGAKASQVGLAVRVMSAMGLLSQCSHR